jgi:hypothetical protein
MSFGHSTLDSPGGAGEAHLRASRVSPGPRFRKDRALWLLRTPERRVNPPREGYRLLCPAGERVRVSALRGRADGAGELPPRRQPREVHRQVQHDPAHRAFDPHRELEQALAQRRDLGVGAGRAGRAPTQFLEQDSSPPRSGPREGSSPTTRSSCSISEADRFTWQARRPPRMAASWRRRLGD